MPDSHDVASRRRRNLLLCLLPWGYCVAMTARYGYDAPYWDQWWKVPIIEKAFDGSLAFGDLWTQINEHRVFFPNLITVPLARLTHWDLRIELALTLLFATLLFGLIALLFRRAESADRPGAATLWPLPIAAVLIFSFAQHAVWVWSLHMMITMVAFFTTLVVFLLGRERLSPQSFVLAAAAAIIATYSFGAGIVAWPVGLLMLLLRPGPDMRRRAVGALAWCLCAGLTMLGYFIQYQSTPANQNALDTLMRPLALAHYLLAHIGAPLFSYSPALAATAGALGTLAAALLIWKLFQEERAATTPFIGLMAVAWTVAGLAALKQAHEGAAQALSPRYVIWPAFFWVGLLGLAYIWRLRATDDDAPRARRVVAVASIAILLLGLGSSAYGTYRADERHDAFLLGRKALPEGRVDSDLLYLYPDTDVPTRMRETLVKYRLSIFRND